MNSNEYEKFIQNKMPKPKTLKNCILAFIVGGVFSDVGQLITNIFKKNGFNSEQTSAGTALVLVFIGAILTGVGIYDKIGKFAGAGSIVPITGFANSIVSPAMEFKREGFVFGVGARMFTVAGPVLVFGISSSIIVGIIYYLFF
jgi:stage V sporulation protein AC